MIAAATLGLFARTAHFPFVSFDDLAYVAHHPRVGQGLSRSNLAWAVSTFDQANWHPLTWFSHMLDVTLFGLRPGAMHVVNALLHTANAVLLLAALTFLTGSSGRSAVVAALFAIHPAHVESVAWISERKDLLSTFFGLLALLAYLRYARKPAASRYLLVVVSFAASLLAKATLVTLPFLFLLLDVWPLGRASLAGRGESTAIPGRWARLLLEKLPLLALSALVSVLTILAQSRGGAVVEDPDHHRFANAVVAYVRYLGKLIWPVDLAVFYPIRHEGLPAGQVLAAVCVLLALTFCAVRLYRRAPALPVGWFWFLGTLVPTIGIVKVGSQAMADRYTYFPSIGVFIAVVWGLSQLPSKPLRWTVSVAGGVALAVLGGLCFRQVGFWSDDERLFRHTLAVTDKNLFGHEMLATTLLAHNRAPEAREQLLEAIAIFPNPVTATTLGKVSLQLGRVDEAERALRLALLLDPQHDEATVALADLLASAGRRNEAMAVLMHAAGSWPKPRQESVGERIAIGAALVDLGRAADGVTLLQELLRHFPGNPEVLSSLSAAYFYSGDSARAEEFALDALARGATGGGALLVLGTVRASRGDPVGAVEALERAVRADPEEPIRRLSFAEALANNGRLTEACASWSLVLRSSRALPSDRERAEQARRGRGCPSGL